MPQKIFIHSFHRSSSTYFLKKFVSDKSLLFYEPFHDMNLLDSPKTHKENHQKDQANLGHDFMDKEHSGSIYDGYISVLEKKPNAANAHSLNFDIKNYLEKNLSSPEEKYLTLLDEAAVNLSKIPVFGCVRSKFRVSQIRRRLGGYHIALLRNPFSVWGSYWRQQQMGNGYFLSYLPKVYLFHKENELLSKLLSDCFTGIKIKDLDFSTKFSCDYYAKLKQVEESLAYCSIEDHFKIFSVIYILGSVNAIMYSDDCVFLYDSCKSKSQYLAIKKKIESKFSIDLNFDDHKQDKKYVYYNDFKENCDDIIVKVLDVLSENKKVFEKLFINYNSKAKQINSFEVTLGILRNFLMECSSDYSICRKKSNNLIASQDSRYNILRRDRESTEGFFQRILRHCRVF